MPRPETATQVRERLWYGAPSAHDLLARLLLGHRVVPWEVERFLAGHGWLPGCAMRNAGR